MHIPDGFISPKMYAPAYVAAAGLWLYGLGRVRRKLDDEAVPRVAVLTAFSFVLMMVLLPLPGGTSVHATGIGILAVLFGVWTAFLSLSLVLLLQALLFGSGGITSLPVNALAMGLAGSAAAIAAYRALRPLHERAALFAAGWISVNLSALILAIALGLQPSLARAADGTPLFFPFGLSVTIPAVMIPHAVVGVGEGALTVMVCGLFARLARSRAS
ncbi:MAG: energy-coupling factor ABC transporter permease [Candidatus Eisenbacteria bacterium]